MVRDDFIDSLRRRLATAGLSVSDEAAKQLFDYYQLLSRWNRRVNLTSLPLDEFPGRTLDRLIVEPLVAASLLREITGRQVDLGSGGGSPAVPMKIVRPSEPLTMVESRERKSAFLREVTTQLDLKETEVLTLRVQELPGTITGAAVVSIRALRWDTSIAAAVDRMMTVSGRLVLFGVEEPPAGFDVVGVGTVTSGSTVSILRRT